MHTAYLSLGSNMDAERNLRRLAAALRAQFTVMAISPVYETAPVGLGVGSENYLNAAAVIQTEDDPVRLKAALKTIEAQLGRTSGEKHVVADADIVLFDDQQYSSAMLGGKRPIPDPAILTEAYVCVPLADVAPEVVHPITGQTLAAIAAAMRSERWLRARPDIRLSEY